MKFNDFTRSAMLWRKTQRDMLKDGWELVDDGGGKLWELNRGYRWRQQIVNVKIAPGGKALWVKIEESPFDRREKFLSEASAAGWP